jgi:glycosyltransferase involved in cell wall biosynthesis
MKPPDHPQPSGDRRVARLLMAALAAAGHRVEVASRFRSYDGAGDVDRQRRLARLGERLATRLIRRYRAGPAEARPRAWITYHLYHKAPDRLGPAVADALGIPYLVAEASHAPKRAAGPWAEGLAAAAWAIGRADAVIGLNSADAPCVRPLLRPGAAYVSLAPFLDPGPYVAAARDRDAHRAALAGRLGIAAAEPWLLAVAMMRPGGLADLPWRLLVAGDGPAAAEATAALAPLGDRVVHLGLLGEEELIPVYAASDMLAWPAVDEAYGMALLEAQAAGVPVVAGLTGGVPDVVGDPDMLVAPGDDAAFAGRIAAVLTDPGFRRAKGAEAQARVVANHGLEAAARTLDAALSLAAEARSAEAGG